MECLKSHLFIILQSCLIVEGWGCIFKLDFDTGVDWCDCKRSRGLKLGGCLGNPGHPSCCQGVTPRRKFWMQPRQKTLGQNNGRSFRVPLSVEVPQPEFVCSQSSTFGHTNVMYGLHSASLSPTQGASSDNLMMGYRHGGTGLKFNAQFFSQ